MPDTASLSEAAGTYDNPYYSDNVYGHTRRLLEELGVSRGGVHLDLGCGYGRIAEALRDEMGLEYVGMDLDEGGLASLRQRGFEAHGCDLRDPDAVERKVRETLGARRLGSISIMDTLEHLPEPPRLLEVMYRVAREHGAPLTISVPNVAHRDVGFKLAFGRWDEQGTGLLDVTHLRFFTAESLDRMMHAAGWHETRRSDVLLEKSDQHFPPLHPALAGETVLGQVLRRLRDSVDENGSVNQFVRAYLPGPKKQVDGLEKAPAAPFLSVVTRTQGRRLDTFRDVLLCLSSQTSQDFEVVVIGHRLDQQAQLAVERVIDDVHKDFRPRVRFLRVDHGNRTTPLNVGFSEARGDYVAILDDDDFVFADWVETFQQLAARMPGRVLRAGAVAQTSEPVSTLDGRPAVRAAGTFERRYTKDFDLFQHLVENQTPPVSVAFPRSVFRDLRIRFDEQLTTTEDWDFLLRTVAVCGLANSHRVTSVYRQWKQGESSFTVHPQQEWVANHQQIWRKLDLIPLLLPPGSASRLRQLYTASASGQVVVSDEQTNQLRERARVILTSRSWALTAPVRWLQRLLGRPRREFPRLWAMTGTELQHLVWELERSPSWRLLAPLRGIRQRFRRL